MDEDELFNALAPVSEDEDAFTNNTKILGNTPPEFFGNPCGSAPCLFGGTCVNIPTPNIFPPFACVCTPGKLLLHFLNRSC
jgi:hypothetical protein